VPRSLAPAEASLAARQCARCHAKQYREWEGSLHHGADSPGLRAQIDYAMADATACRRCHAPLAEQADPVLRAAGASCAGCHVRTWQRHGPPNLAPSLARDPAYPLTTLPIYERADLCLPCHQLPPRDALEGKPLLDTYREWLAGPYMPRGIQCQHCHMPNREHQFLGIHDRETFRQGIRLRADAVAKGGVITAIAELTNIGAGHDLPTTPTPAAWLRIELLDARGTVVGRTQLRIGRELAFDTELHELADTRIPPGEHAMLARAFPVAATTMRVTVEVHPDDYYEGLYAKLLAGQLVPAQRALFEQALARGRASHYIAEQRDLPIR
jgi:ribosomal protein L40E